MIDLAVVGGGAAGLMAAGAAAEAGLEVLLLEKNDKSGKKLLLTGKGRCNVTNAVSVREMVANIPGNGKFLTNVFYRFDSRRFIEFLEKSGVETKTERGGRVFPVSDSSREILDCLRSYARESGAEVLHRRVRGVEREKECFRVRIGRDRFIYTARLLLATGGKSYPATGSTGEGYSLARSLGHEVVPPRPALVPLCADIPGLDDLQGLSLRNVGFKVEDSLGKSVFHSLGEVLFTHFGLSGPLPLSASLHMSPGEKYTLSIDLKPGLSVESLADRIGRDFAERGRKKIKNAMDALMPGSIIPVVLRGRDVDGDKQAAQASKKDLLDLARRIKDVRLDFLGFRSFKEAIVTAGGVDVSRIDPRTLESRLVPGLYFAGEVMDVHGYTGGFNLHIAFSTGYVAGKACAGVRCD